MQTGSALTAAALSELLDACAAAAVALDESANVLASFGLHGFAKILRNHAVNIRASLAKAQVPA